MKNIHVNDIVGYANTNYRGKVTYVDHTVIKVQSLKFPERIHNFYHVLHPSKVGYYWGDLRLLELADESEVKI